MFQVFYFSLTMPRYTLGPKGWSEKLELEVCNDKTKQKNWFSQTLSLFCFKGQSINYSFNKNVNVYIGQIGKSEKQWDVLALSLYWFCNDSGASICGAACGITDVPDTQTGNKQTMPHPSLPSNIKPLDNFGKEKKKASKRPWRRKRRAREEGEKTFAD